MVVHQKTSTVVKGGKQKRQGNFYMPKEIQHLGDMPLYRAVACWGYLTQKEFTRNDVSEAFKIDTRRASGVLNYICHRNDRHDIAFKVRKASVRGGNCQLMLTILSPATELSSPTQRLLAASGNHK